MITWMDIAAWVLITVLFLTTVWAVIQAGRRYQEYEMVEVVIRPEDLEITSPEQGKLRIKVDSQLFRGVHYEILGHDEAGNKWLIHSTKKATVGEEIGLTFEPEAIHVMRFGETEDEFDKRLEAYGENGHVK